MNSSSAPPPTDPTYRLPLDYDVIPLGAAEWLCQAGTRTVRLAGPHARLVVERVLPVLQAGGTWSHLVDQLPEIAPAALHEALMALRTHGLVTPTPTPAGAADVPALAPFLALLESLHLPVETARARLAQAHLTFVGLEGVGAHLAVLLARWGLTRFTLLDPYPCHPGNLALLPVGTAAAVGHPRQDVVAAALREVIPAPQLILGPAQLTAPQIAAAVAGRTGVVSCFDRGFAATHLWVNQASLQAGVPAVYAEAVGHQGWAGPLVLPGQTACYLCYRMRRAACAPDPEAALAIETYFAGQRDPHLHTRAVLPGLMPHLASHLAMAVLQVILGLEPPVLAGYVLECQALTLTTLRHPVLQQPECPACGGPPGGGPPHPTLAELAAPGTAPADLVQLAPDLVSAQTGLIQAVHWYTKDADEPLLPYIYQVTLANHLLRAEGSAADRTCWGKGLTEADAQGSGLGEALERYAGDLVDPTALVHARRADLDGPSLDPRDLVLYAPEQYGRVPYPPYTDATRLGWVAGRSLVNGQRVYLPALAVFMGYPAQTPEEALFPVTSNGLAAGASLTHALLAATYEVLERDAFMLTWFGRLPTRRIDPLTHPDRALRDLCRAYARRGVRIGLWRLPTDHPATVFLALGLHAGTPAEPAVIAGLGADLSPARAARKAILEVGQIRPSYRRSLRRPATRQRLARLVHDPQQVADMHDHGLLYCSPAVRPALDFLVDQGLDPMEWGAAEPTEPLAQLDTLVAHYRATSGDLLYYNLTPPDLARWGLAAARVICPGFQPIAFGAQEPRLGGRRLYDLPHRLGLAPAPLAFQDLNPDPHPFD